MQRAAKDRGYRTASAFIRAAIESEIKSRNEIAGIEEQTAASFDRVSKEVRRVLRSQQALFALLDALTRVVLTCVAEPSVRDEIPGHRSGEGTLHATDESGGSDNGDWRSVRDAGPNQRCPRAMTKRSSGLDRARHTFRMVEAKPSNGGLASNSSCTTRGRAADVQTREGSRVGLIVSDARYESLIARMLRAGSGGSRTLPGARRRGRRRCCFDALENNVELPSRLRQWQAEKDELLWKVIIAPEFGDRVDLQKLTRELMQRMAKDLNRPLEWSAVMHSNTEHPHVHVALRGDWRQLKLPRNDN